MSNIKNVITHLYRASADIPVSVTVDVSREDEVYAEKTFKDVNSANEYINNKEYEDEVESFVQDKKQEITDDIYDDVDVSYDSSEEAKTEIKEVSVDSLSSYEVENFLRTNPSYKLASQEIVTSYYQDADSSVHPTVKTEKKKIFVEVVTNEEERKKEVNERVSS